MFGNYSYYGATDEIMAEHGGQAPNCPRCGQPQFPMDDHGRFGCFCAGGFVARDEVAGETLMIPTIPQVDVSGMSDEEKAKIPPINRLYGTPTAAESALFTLSAKGPDCMDDPAYFEAAKVLEDEKRQAGFDI
jgi:hypothetical protein